AFRVIPRGRFPRNNRYRVLTSSDTFHDSLSKRSALNHLCRGSLGECTGVQGREDGEPDHKTS
ncbi:hypothetical protein, partial [Candidatus Binatus soli]|uniref:hypothetical protein n=1 Tax=Candidatus Binatus soli TaxID=1953413 RepID=UPI003D101D01